MSMKTEWKVAPTFVNILVISSVGNPLEMANVIAFKKGTKFLQSYSITDSKGNYRLTLEQNQAYTFKVSYLGYDTQNIDVSIDESSTAFEKHIVLKESRESLSAVELSYEMPVKIVGDTIVYNAESFITGTEKKLEDVLEKLPGIDIDEVLQKVKVKVDEAKRDLPQVLEDDPAVFEINLSEMPIIVYSLTGPGGLSGLKEIADDIEEDIESVSGVLEVAVTGGLEREIVIDGAVGKGPELRPAGNVDQCALQRRAQVKLLADATADDVDLTECGAGGLVEVERCGAGGCIDIDGQRVAAAIQGA